MIRYLITDGTAQLATTAAWLAAGGVDFVQIRERHLSPRDLAAFTRAILQFPNPRGARILVNDRADIALATGAHGVHLRDGSPPPQLFKSLGLMVTVAAHSLAALTQLDGADYILLAPVFTPLSKAGQAPALGVEALRKARELTKTPILALGGITEITALQCMDGGAAGIAGIDYFSRSPR